MAGVHVLQHLEVGPVLTAVLPRLHLAVDHSCVVTLSIDVVHLCQEGGILESEGRTEQPQYMNKRTSPCLVTTTDAEFGSLGISIRLV